MDRQYVGIDFHRRRSVIVRLSAAGEKLSSVRIPNDPVAIAAAVAEAGPDPEVVVEATYGWYWVVDLLEANGARVHLANPQGLNWGQRRVKNDERDAIDLADMLRLGRLPEAWIAPPAVRELRELVRYRARLVALRSGLKAQVHAVMAKEGVLPAAADLFCVAGNAQLDGLAMADNYTTRVESLRDLIELYDREVALLEREIHIQLRGHHGYHALQAINAWGAPSPRSWWPRSATSTGSAPPRHCARGPVSRLATASPTSRPPAARSPSKARSWCAGRSSKR
jgi:transposase